MIIKKRIKKQLIFILMASFLAGCASQVAPINGKRLLDQKDGSSLGHLMKSDIDRLADVEMRENTESLRLLMTKLYKRNPAELKKSTSGTVDEMVAWVFEGDQKWSFEMLGGLKETDAIYLAFKAEYKGDRVLALVVGLQTMVIKARGGKTEFFLTDSVDPQNVYNSARNVEIAAWKLSNTRDEAGKLYFQTNEMNGKEQNLSFEREIGRMVGRIDLYALTLSEKSQRGLTRFTQGVASALFLPI
ncbi:putative lipoprotein [Candidatus Methylopumilus turicensis]|uniref:Putative lipoprotein n=1 Tax=Candidatus Methylopumilus turicensis TaxID=1581680 RepID=A0A0B7IUV7_9PROT|nr:putative lipoprotein [Candidatus Methylopumilus turicensis]